MNLISNLALLLALPSAFAQDQTGTSFARTYKLGEKTTYTVNHQVKLLGSHSLTVDITFSTAKLLPKERAELGVHWSNLQTSDENDTTTLPGDFTVRTTTNNMPEHFEPSQGSISFYVAFLMLAGATADKPVKVGDESPVAWDGGGGSLSFKGTIKVLEITPEKKRMKALIKVKPTMGGQEAGDITFTSTYDLTDRSLIESTGNFVIAGNSQDFAFTRKTSPGK